MVSKIFLIDKYNCKIGLLIDTCFTHKNKFNAVKLSFGAIFGGERLVNDQTHLGQFVFVKCCCTQNKNFQDLVEMLSINSSYINY